DVQFATSLMQIDNRWFPKLHLGTAVIRLPTRFYTPFLIAFHAQPIKNISVTDDAVHVWRVLTDTGRKINHEPPLGGTNLTPIRDINIGTLNETTPFDGRNPLDGREPLGETAPFDASDR